jgi:transcriptional regulator with GAF, ATPase, and Fis domain
MTWILNLESREDTRAIAEAVCNGCADLRLVDAPDSDELTGVLVCTSTTANLRPVIARAASAGTRVIVVAPAYDHPEPWSLLASGAADLVLWNDDASPVWARLARLHEVERLVAAPPVSGLMLGSSPALRRALRDLVTAARFGRGPILILGETGTGKELAARVAHLLSAERSTGPLVIVDCTTIVPTLSGSELFGHERGAFTGAMTVRTGACAAASGGTLLLDEVGELPLDLQPELLRVVQEGMYKRVGSDRWQRTDFRLICATNRDLESEVAAGRFRSDFYYRIAASTIRLPPLRERPEDIVPLFEAFVAQASGTGVELSPAVAAVVRQREYPGNLRDLRQLALRVAARHVGPGPITPGDLPVSDRPRTAVAAPSTNGSGNGLAESVHAQLKHGLTLRELREQVADLAVEIALREAGGNVRAAAARLGVTDRALHLRRAQRREANSEANSA